MTSASARIAVLHAPARVRAVALLIHGGPVESWRADSTQNPAYLRMLPFGPPIVSRSHGHMAVAALRYRYRGWNDPEEPGVEDALWALDRIAARRPGCPVALIGHSMGGRVAMRVAGHPAVRAVVGVSPWAPEGDPRPSLEGRALLVLHGTHDLITSWRRSEELVEQLRGEGVDATFEPLARRGHNLLLTRGPYRLASEFVVDRVS